VSAAVPIRGFLCKASSSQRWRGTAEKLGQPPQILRRCCEQHFVSGTTQASQLKSVEPEKAFHSPGTELWHCAKHSRMSASGVHSRRFNDVRVTSALPPITAVKRTSRHFAFRDMSAFVRGCDAIREKTGAAVLVLHHDGKDASKGGRVQWL
jgi:hypothetical protein